MRQWPRRQNEGPEAICRSLKTLRKSSPPQMRRRSFQPHVRLHLLAISTGWTDNLDQLLSVLPDRLRDCLGREPHIDDLIEVVLDLGRPAEARFASRVVELRPVSDSNRDMAVGDASGLFAETPEEQFANEVTQDDIDYVTTRIGDFGLDNRAGIERTLHRISAIRNRRDRIVGLTMRIGRAVYGTIDIIRDIVESGKSILMLGRPGVGKTTKLREVARHPLR